MDIFVGIVVRKMKYKIACLVNDKSLWALRPFCHLFNKFWKPNEQVDIVGFNPPQFDLPDNFNFISLDNTNWPSSKWTNQLISYLLRIKEDYVIFFLEDYWLKEPVDMFTVKSMVEYAPKEPNLLRIDLTADRASQRHIPYHEYNGVDIIQTVAGTPYQMSYQVGIWSRKKLLEVLVSNENAWQSEIDGSKRLDDSYLVLGIKEHPVKYVPVLTT